MITDCKSILVDRAVFGSSNQGAIKGYQLLGWSSGIDAEISRELNQWAPTRLHQMETDGYQLPWLAQAFPIGTNRMCVGRTFISGQEYSGRGGWNVVSTFVLFDPDQWLAYNYDALGVLQTAMALGHMRLPIDFRNGLLQQVSMPATLPLPSARFFGASSGQADDHFQATPYPLQTWADKIELGRRLILVGLNRPIAAVANIIERMSPPARKRFSFTTGLPLSIHRPFQLHCTDAALYRQQLSLAGWLSDEVDETQATVEAELSSGNRQGYRRDP